jgi:hypothetical protein
LADQNRGDNMVKLEDKVIEFAKIAKKLPENLQQTCFELLLKDYLKSSQKPGSAKLPGDVISVKKGATPESVEEVTKKQEDLTKNEIHVKVRHFMKKYSVTLDDLNNIFYKEGGAILPLYEDLKTTRISEGQIRIALLQALNRAIQTGDYEADVEEIRTECVDRKCYDSANFATNFRNNKTLFDFDKYTKGTKTVRLSENGRKELAQLVKELQ